MLVLVTVALSHTNLLHKIPILKTSDIVHEEHYFLCFRAPNIREKEQGNIRVQKCEGCHTARTEQP